jgi:hypothetical protein
MALIYWLFCTSLQRYSYRSIAISARGVAGAPWDGSTNPKFAMTPKHTTLFIPVRHCNLRNFLIGALLLAWLPVTHSALPAPSQTSDGDIAPVGFFCPSWKGGKVADVELREIVARGIQGGRGYQH